jgi:glycerol-3-phosphate dehydrogenase (NAD(P)+)
MSKVAILGAGGWGTALACILTKQDHQVLLWSRNPEVAAQIAQFGENKLYLPDVILPEGLTVTLDLEEALRFSRHVIITVPAQGVRAIMQKANAYVTPQHTILSCAKGLEQNTGLRISQVIEEIIPQVSPLQIACLSGPNHAEEVSREIPSATVIASPSEKAAEDWQEIIMTPFFRVYTSDDVLGVELSGALKNVIAIAAGISDGLKFGDNTKATILTRGLAEIVRLGVKLGACPHTFSGLSGIGDLMVTANSCHSRNRAAGEAIGRGATLEETVNQIMVVEGIPTCKAAMILSQKCQIEMPITAAVYHILFNGLTPKQAVISLMNRGPKSELEAFLRISG